MAIALEILTPTGFQKFDGVKKYTHSEYLLFTFEDGSELKAAFDHKFIIDGLEILARNVRKGDNPGKVVRSVHAVYEPVDLYDPTNVSGGEIYTHDESLVSHNTFAGTSNTLLNGECLLSLKASEPKEINNLVKYYHLPVRADEEDGTHDHVYIMTVDVAKGRGQDYSTFTVFDVSTKPFMQVCTFRCNLISPLLFPDVIVRVAKQYNDAAVIIENNDAGVVVCNTVYYEYEYENTFVESTTKSGGIGVTMTKRVKRIGCSHMKDLIESGNLQICDGDTITELSIFEHTGNSNSYAAAGDGHDDLVMNIVLFAWFVSSSAFGNIAELDLKNLMYADRMREMEDDVPSFGVIAQPDSDHYDPVWEEMVRQRQEWAL